MIEHIIKFRLNYDNHNDCKNLLKLYKHSFLWLLLVKASLLNNPGIKYITKGKNNDTPKPIRISFNKCI